MSDRWRNRLLPFAGLAASVACVGIMGWIVYRRFYLPLGALQLELHWGDWFSSPPLTVPFALRMDTAAGVLSGAVAFAALISQIYAAAKGYDPRWRGAASMMAGAFLFFLLSDNLVLAVSALALTSPLVAITTFLSPMRSATRERISAMLLCHGLGDAAALCGLFFLYRLFGTLSYKPLAAQVAGLPGLGVAGGVGLALLLTGIALHTSAGMFGALMALGGAFFIGYRVEEAVRLAPGGVPGVALAASAAWAVATLALARGASVRLSPWAAKLRAVVRGVVEVVIERWILHGTAALTGRGIEKSAAAAAGVVAKPVGAGLSLAVFAAVVWTIVERLR
ncbi:MAG: hypothetical protein M5R36_23455 [Deltaproteobacteria bacterium]|nr:hypothetical protein [Deltaproteobacteria bacterium]